MSNLKLQKERLPSFLKLLFFVELWERFSYYGMRALLVLFLTSNLGFADQRAYSVYSVFAAICYMIPVISGILADKLFGSRNMVLIGAIVMILGHISMVFVSIDTDLIFLGLALIATGTGLFKGNITALLGECYEADDSSRSQGFTLFYVGVNLGSFLASISCGYIAAIYGWEYGFGLAGIGMIIGLGIFLKFQYILQSKGTAKREIPYYYIIFAILSAFVGGFFIAQLLKYSEYFGNILQYFGVVILTCFVMIMLRQEKEQRKKLIALTILIIFTMLFFALEMQLGSFINLFTHRNVQDHIFGIYIPASISQAINPLAIIIFGFMIGKYDKLGKKYDMAKFGFGIFAMAICFAILYLGCLNANAESKVGYIYLFFGLAAMSLGEIFIGPIVQAQATLLAPTHLRGFIMGILMLFLAFSNLAGIIISKFVSVPEMDGKIDLAMSLQIYEAGFAKIAIVNILFTLIFLLFYKFLVRVTTMNK
jgi:POT family proton-dependent oligopeptide transporter